MARRELKDRRALVTGASSGIGRALALELARQGVDMVLLARRADRLQEVAADVEKLGRRAIPVVGDVTDPATRRAALDAAQNQFGGLDILVNNAGITAYGRFADASSERLRQIMEVNFFAVAALIREAFPMLCDGKQPVIVNVGSILGIRGTPHNSEYCASKFALHGLSESLRAEFAADGIDVLVVAPATTESELAERAIEKRETPPWYGRKYVTSESVARATIRALQRGKSEIIPSWAGWFLDVANRICPRLIDRILAQSK
jgi:short-subunit dehydrogenase